MADMKDYAANLKREDRKNFTLVGIVFAIVLFSEGVVETVLTYFGW